MERVPVMIAIVLNRSNGDFIPEWEEVAAVSIDVKKNLYGNEQTYIYSGTKATGFDPVCGDGKGQRVDY